MVPLRAAINKAKKENKPARKENVRIGHTGGTKSVNLEVVRTSPVSGCRGCRCSGHWHGLLLR
jgi:hypothetical protein